MELADFIKIEELRGLLLVKLIFHHSGGACAPCGVVWGNPGWERVGWVVPGAPVLPHRLPKAAAHRSPVFSLPQGALLKGKRCVVLADGFYEWQQHGGGKQPYFIYFPQSKDAAVRSPLLCLNAHTQL